MAKADPDDAERSERVRHDQDRAGGRGLRRSSKLLLATQATVPDDCTNLAIAGPVKPLDPHEIDAISKYLEAAAGADHDFRAPRPNNRSRRDRAGEAGRTMGRQRRQRHRRRPGDAAVRGARARASVRWCRPTATHPITKDFKERTDFPDVALGHAVGETQRRPTSRRWR